MSMKIGTPAPAPQTPLTTDAEIPQRHRNISSVTLWDKEKVLAQGLAGAHTTFTALC